MSARARIWSFFLFLIAAACYLLSQTVAAAVRDAAGGHISPTLLRLVALAVLVSSFLFLAGVIERRPRPLVGIGLPFRRGMVREIVIGLILGAGMVELAVILMRLHGGVHFAMTAGAWTVPIAAAFARLTLAAMMEELAFRGYPFQKLVDCLGAPIAVVVLAGVFGLLHRFNPHATITSTANTAFVGVLFAVAYLRTRALWLPWGIHFAWNFTLGVIFGLPVSGLDFSTWARGSALGPAWVTGGSYGIEGGFAGTVAILFGLVVVLLVPAVPRPVLFFEHTSSSRKGLGSGI